MLHKKTKLGKRIWSLLLCLCMVLPCLPVSVFAAGEAEASCTVDGCGGTYENGFCNICDGYQAATLNDNGTADDTTDDYYEIGNAGQLYWFAAKVNGGDKAINGKLTADITVNPGTFNESNYISKSGETPRTWTPIGVNSINTSFYKGTFDGDGKTISGLYYYGNDNYVGLFGSIGGGTIKNLGIVNSRFHLWSPDSDKGRQVGGLVGKIYSCNDVTLINNCYTDVVLKEVGDHILYGGGLIGEIQTEKYSVVVKDCRSTGKVSMSDDGDGFYLIAGGLVGSILDDKLCTVDVTDCYSTSDVEVESCSERPYSYTWLGGLVGCAIGNITVQNCYSTGAVSASANVSSGANDIKRIDVRAGGLLGYAEEKGSITVQNCYSTGAVNASANVSSINTDIQEINVTAGGLIGYVESGTTVQNCYSTGAVSTVAELSESKYEKATFATAGGLLGYAESSATVQNCYNTGAVKARIDSEGTDGTINVGAVIGKLTGTGTGTFGGIYYLLPRKGDAEEAVGSNTTSITINATKKSADEFASGEVCYLLNGGTDKGTETAPLVWYQILVEGGDPSPVLDSTHGIVSYNGSTYVSTGTLAATVSVTITWTSMAFTYTDGAWNPETHDYDIGTWSTSGGTIKVENTGNVTVTASFAYASETAGNGISGSFDASSFDLDEKASQTTKLTLSGKPSQSLNNESIGTITVMIAQKNE